MKRINQTQALEMLNNTNGKVFGVEFIKADGSVRKMSARMDVTKHLKGGVATYKGKDGSIPNIGVYEMSGKGSGYKCFRLDRLRKLKIGHEEYSVEG